MAQGRPKRCVLVLGMHNSGTSLLGNLMHGAGVQLGPHLLLRDRIPEERRPKYDYYEDEEIVRLQDATLLHLQRHWSSYRASWALPSADHPSREHFRQNLERLIPKRLGRHTHWLVKDPRSAILIEDWLLVLRRLAVQPRLLLVHRDPTSNIRSFSSKGQVPPLWAEALWQRTYQQALLAIRDLPENASAITRFEDLLQQPLKSVLELCEWLEHPISARQRDQLSARVDQNLPSLPPSLSSNEGRAMHPATISLTEQLLGRHRWAPPDILLADDLQQALLDCEAPLQLNRIRADAQSLLPKVTVTIVTSELQGWGPGGGIGSAFRELATTLASAGHCVTVLLVSSQTSLDGAPLAGVQVCHLQSTGCSRLELVRRVASWLRAHPCDVVHLHDWLGLASGLRTALQPHPPQLIVGLHGPSAWTRTANPWPREPSGALNVDVDVLGDEGLVRALELDGLHQADWLISPSQAMATWVERQLLDGQRPEHLVVNRNCPLSQRLRPAPPTNNPATAAGIDFVYFGRLEQRKGLELFLQALLKMSQRPKRVLFLGSDCVVGRRTNGEEIMGTQLVDDQLRGSDIAVLHEPGLLRDEALALLMRLHAVVVIPSLIENSPCVVEELLDSGLQMVTTNVGGTAELVNPDDRHWLSASDPESLAMHLQQALSASRTPSRAYRLRSATETWRIQLSWQAFHERLPRQSGDTGKEANAAAETKGAVPSAWLELLRRARRKAGRGRLRLLAMMRGR